MPALRITTDGGGTVDIGMPAVAVWFEDRSALVVLLPYMSDWRSTGRSNLRCYDTGTGEVRWIAPLPTQDPAEAYTGLASQRHRDGSVMAWCWSGSECEIDLATGAVLRKTFTK